MEILIQIQYVTKGFFKHYDEECFGLQKYFNLMRLHYKNVANKNFFVDFFILLSLIIIYLKYRLQSQAC